MNLKDLKEKYTQVKYEPKEDCKFCSGSGEVSKEVLIGKKIKVRKTLCVCTIIGTDESDGLAVVLETKQTS